MPYLFVYGTLMRGDVRSGWLEGARFLGEARTSPRYRLVDCGEYPGLIEAATEGRSIEGELYEIDEAAWPVLDEVEGVDEGLYRRGPVALLPPWDRQPVEAYFYLRLAEQLPDCGSRWRSRPPSGSRATDA